MRLSKIGKVVKEARQCVLCNTRERTGQEANLIQQWIGTGEAMYPVDENVRLTEQGAAALMEMDGKDAEAVAWRSVGDGSELAEALKGIPARIDSAALAWKVCLKVETHSGTVRVKELEDGSMAYVWEQLLEPCKRKGKLLLKTPAAASSLAKTADSSAGRVSNKRQPVTRALPHRRPPAEWHPLLEPADLQPPVPQAP